MANDKELYFSEIHAAGDLDPALAKSIQSNTAMLELVQLIEHAALTKFADEDGTLKRRFKSTLKKIPDLVLVNTEVRPLYKKSGLSVDDYAKEFGKRAIDGMIEAQGLPDDIEKQIQFMLVQAKVEETVEMIAKSFNEANLRLELLAHMKELLKQEGITPAYRAEPEITLDDKDRHILYVNLSNTPQVQRTNAARKVREVFSKMGVAILDQEHVPDGVVLSDPATNSNHCTALVSKMYEISKNRGMGH